MNKPSLIHNTSDSPRANASSIPIRSISLGLAIAATLYVGMATLINWSAFTQAVLSLPTLLWLELVLLSLLSYLIRFARWHFFLISLGHRIPLLRSLEIYFSAFALTLTPGKLGETIRSLYLHPYGINYSQSIAAFVSERALDLLAVGGLALLATVALSSSASTNLSLGVAALVAAALLWGLCIWQKKRNCWLRQRWKKIFSLLQTLSFLLSNRRLAVGIPLSLMAWAAQGTSLYLIVSTWNENFPLSTAIFIYCSSILVGAISFIPGGLGTTEASIALQLSGHGLGWIHAITASLVGRALTLWLAVSLGILAMIQVGVRTRKEAQT